MGFLQKIGKALIEEVPTENEVMSMDMEAITIEDVIDVELESVDTNTLINDIYTQNDLFDMSRSIFKVEELITSLPKEMTTSTKRASVLAILGSFNLTATEIVEDGENRLGILDRVKTKVDTDSKIALTDKEAQIEELKKNIETLAVEIINEQERMKKSDEIILSEIERINALIQFVGGEN